MSHSTVRAGLTFPAHITHLLKSQRGISVGELLGRACASRERVVPPGSCPALQKRDGILGWPSCTYVTVRRHPLQKNMLSSISGRGVDRLY